MRKGAQSMYQPKKTTFDGSALIKSSVQQRIFHTQLRTTQSLRS